ncbi:MAG: hypothetical protein KC425_12595, partial [Anaerolineales bacterium]|nr:hypothetical protein [Anaerolineales bacterium]
MRRRLFWLGMVLLLALPGAVWGQETAEPQPIVQAVLFYSPTCPHCHQVITQDLPPIQEKYGAQLQILGVDTST